MVLYSIIASLYGLFVLSLVLIVVLENRQPVKTVAWILVLSMYGTVVTSVCCTFLSKWIS